MLTLKQITECMAGFTWLAIGSGKSPLVKTVSKPLVSKMEGHLIPIRTRFSTFEHDHTLHLVTGIYAISSTELL
jgi:hypothetical protein